MIDGDITVNIFSFYFSYMNVNVALHQLALRFRFLAAGDSMSSMTYQYLVDLTTVSNIIATTCEIIWKRLCPLILPSQLLEDYWRSIAEDFEDIWDFPHCIGAIDGKHVTIQVSYTCIIILFRHYSNIKNYLEINRKNNMSRLQFSCSV